MNAPTILCTDPRNSIPFGTIEDMQLTKLLSDNAAHMLTHPCGGGTILLRRELFLKLEDAAMRGRFADFRDKLRELSKMKSLHVHASGEAEKIFTLAALEKRVADVWSAVPELRGCALTNALSDFWEDDERKAALARIVDGVKRANALLSRVDCFDLSFSDRSWVAQDYGSVSYEQTVRKCAVELGFESGATTPRMRTHPGGIAISPATDAPYCALFADILNEARTALVPYLELPLEEFLQLLPEVSFCLEISELVSRAREFGLPVCMPRVSESRKYTARGACDVTLLYKNVSHIVPNDIIFDEDCAFSFLVGANGGGKTTFLRCVGANLILFLAGAPIFAEDAEIYTFTDVKTHFPADERLLDGGRLEDEARRVSAMLDLAGQGSFLLFNETFSGTNDKYGCELTENTGRRIKERGLFGLFVTHFHELAESSEEFDFLEAVVTGGENERTFKIERRRSAKSSFAHDILKKYGLDRESLEKRAAEERADNLKGGS